jgi:hypothetical protein
MGKKNKKPKKVSAKKEKYAKFKKEKNTTIDLTMPELTPEQMKQRQIDEQTVNSFLRYSKNPPTKELKDRKKR